MTWGHYAYAIAGVLLTFWVLMNDGEDPPIINAALASLLVGPFIGVPFFIIVLVFFGNWPVLVRNVWIFVTYPVAWHLERRAKAQSASTMAAEGTPASSEPNEQGEAS